MDQGRGNLVKQTNSALSHSVALTEKFTLADTSYLIACMVQICGEKFGGDMKILADQWHDALQFFDRERVINAWREYRDNRSGDRRKWPEPSDLIAIIRRDLPRPARVAEPKEEPVEFCREGRTKAEEIAHRAAFCLRMRAQYPTVFNPPAEEERKPLPASDLGPTSALIALAKANGYYRGSDEDEQAA